MKEREKKFMKVWVVLARWYSGDTQETVAPCWTYEYAQELEASYKRNGAKSVRIKQERVVGAPLVYAPIEQELIETPEQDQTPAEVTA